jgi:hypothetical protein
MNTQQAKAILALFQAYFPSPKLPDSTVEAWATELMGYDVADAQAAVGELARVEGRRRPVELAEILAGCKRARLRAWEAQQMERAQQALGVGVTCTLQEWLRDYATDAERETVHRLGWWRKTMESL